MHGAWLPALFGLLWLLALLWHVVENRSVKRNPAGATFYPLLIGRSIQCLLLLAVCFVLMAIVLMKSAVPVAVPQPVVSPVVIATPPAAPEVSAPVPAESPTPQPVTEDPAENTLDRIKEKYEEALVNYFFLRQCKKAGDEEYRIIMSALQAELQQRMAPASMVQNILLAAQGSYNEIYSRLPCDHKDAASQEAQFRRYLEKLKAKR